MVALSVTPSELARHIEFTPPHHAIMTWGPPGVGKTEVIESVARRRRYHLVVRRPSEMEPSDLMGLPDIRDGFTVYAPDRELYELTEKYERRRQADDPGFRVAAALFFDEITNATPAVQSVLQCIILNRTFGWGGLKLAAGVRIFLAGNRETDGAFAQDLSTAMKSRIRHVEVAPDLREWLSWAMEHEVHPNVRAFLRHRQRLFHDFDPKTKAHTFPCPRTWVLLSDALRLMDDEGHTAAGDRRIVAEGYVGPGAGAEFHRFERTAVKCPSADEIVANPEGVPNFDSDPDMALVCVENLLSAIRSDPDHYIDGALDFVDRLHAEYRLILHTSVLNLYGDQTTEVIAAGLDPKRFPRLQASLTRMNRVTGAA